MPEVDLYFQLLEQTLPENLLNKEKYIYIYKFEKYIYNMNETDPHSNNELEIELEICYFLSEPSGNPFA